MLTNSFIILFMLARGSVKSSSSVGGGHSSSWAFDIVPTFKFAILYKIQIYSLRTKILGPVCLFSFRSIDDKCHKSQMNFIFLFTYFLSKFPSLNFHGLARDKSLPQFHFSQRISFYYYLFILFFRGRKCILLESKKKKKSD